MMRGGCVGAGVLGAVLAVLAAGEAKAQPYSPPAPNCPIEDFCCGNGLCEDNENQSNCSRDCGRCPDGTCDPYEQDHSSCPQDCGPACVPQGCAGRCGTVTDCGQIIDCGPCANVCGNGIPDPGETCTSCPNDVMAKPTFTVTPATAGVGEAITFQADAATILNLPVPLWDMGNNDHRSGTSLTYSYSQPGQYPVRLTASESACGQTRVTDPKTVSVGSTGGGNQPPVARTNGPYSGRVLQSINFDGSASTDPNGNSTIASYRWNFGDGTSSSGRIVPHAYVEARFYPVDLTVADAQGLTNRAATTADIRAHFDGYFLSQENLVYSSASDSLAVSVSLTILPPHSVTYEPRVRVRLEPPVGAPIDSGLVYQRYDRSFSSPAAGTWRMTVEYYFHRSSLPDPILVGTRTRTVSVGSSGTPPTISGPRSLWWLRGDLGGSALPEQITLDAFGSGSCTWSVDQGSFVVQLSPVGCRAEVRSRAASSFRDDVIITVTANGRRSAPHYLTVNTPRRLRFVSISPDEPFYPVGWRSRIDYEINDQFGARVRNLTVAELFGAATNNYPGGNNWNLPIADSVFSGDGMLRDTISIACYEGDCTPMPVLPTDVQAGTPVRGIFQWFSVTPGHIRIQTNTQQWYRGRGRHTNVLSPVD